MMVNFKSFRAHRALRAAMLTVIIFAALFNCFRATENGGDNVRLKYVVTQYGKVRGHTVNEEYMAFLGIPYAAPPVGSNRFKSPKPPKPWNGVYDAIRTTKCPQKGEGEEDCLMLNIFTPVIFSDLLLPVLVYIHGGSFLLGTGPPGGVEYLIKQNIIVVTINYRLGALGFLCLGIEEAPGNAGLKDQVAALKFVKTNIASFGGDPERVTVYGMSAGAASVEYLILSKQTEDLFHQAIVESGSATAPWALDRNPIKTAKNIAELLNIPNTDFLRLLAEFFAKVPLDLLTQVTYEYYNNLTDGTFGFAPCVEKKLRGGEPIITKPPKRILKKGRYRRVPTMFMFATLEGLYLRSMEYYEQNYKERMEWNFLEFLPADLIFDTDENRNETGKNIYQFYFGNGTDDVIKYLKYFGDSLILHSLLSSVEEQIKACNLVYLMEFAYKGQIGGYEGFYESINVAGHGDVIKYAILNSEPKNEDDKTTVRRVTTLIANYVKYGNPTPTSTSLLPVLWPPASRFNITCLYADREFQVYSEPYWHRKTFWDGLYAKAKRRSGRGRY